MKSRIEAVEQPFPDGVPKRFVGVLTIRFTAEGHQIVNLNVRPDGDAVVRPLVEDWAAMELVRLATDPDGSGDWEEHILPDGVLVMQKYASVVDLPEV